MIAYLSKAMSVAGEEAKPGPLALNTISRATARRTIFIQKTII
jgi:hypothetical protein